MIDEQLLAQNEALVEQALLESERHDRILEYESFEEGFLNGCMALVYFTAPSEDEVLPFDEALALCSEVRTLAGSDRLRASETTEPVEPEHEIDCSRGNCL